MNFSSLAVGLIFGIGAVVIGISLCLETIVGWARTRKRFERGAWKQRAWWTDGTLQLQRKAFEGAGVGDWEVRECDLVPITSTRMTFRGMEQRGEIVPVAEGGKISSTEKKKPEMAIRQVDSALSDGRTSLCMAGHQGRARDCERV